MTAGCLIATAVTNSAHAAKASPPPLTTPCAQVTSNNAFLRMKPVFVFSPVVAVIDRSKRDTRPHEKKVFPSYGLENASKREIIYVTYFFENVY